MKKVFYFLIKKKQQQHNTFNNKMDRPIPVTGSGSNDKDLADRYTHDIIDLKQPM